MAEIRLNCGWVIHYRDYGKPQKVTTSLLESGLFQAP
jgi:hypothetical protein